MTVYVLYDCVENPDEWAFAGVQHVYSRYEDAAAEMKKLYDECFWDHFDNQLGGDEDETYIDGWGAKVVNSFEAYHHTWTITKEEVI